MAFPNTYQIGITSLGFQIVWAALAKRHDLDVRRLFTDQGDKPHRNCDLFGISLSWELDAPIILDLFEKQKIPFWSEERKENDPIVFGGGPVLTANPEPLAPFFDAILLGDAENLLPEFIDKIYSARELSRISKLRLLAQTPGVYIPRFYSPEYSTDGQLLSIKSISSKIPTSISKQTWQGENLSHSQVITPDSAWPNIHMVEVVRSCPELCRFCMASYLTLPFRKAAIKELIPAVEKGIKATNRIGLLGASVTQHPQFMDLINWLNEDQFNKIRLSISSVRATTVSNKLTTLLKNHGSKSITIAIESGSDRLRKVVNKKLSEEEIIAAARYTLEGGLRGLKLYGMVGLPTEEELDVELTANLLLKIKKTVPGLKLTLGISTFVPKAHTPFQWIGLRKDAKKRLRFLEKRLKSNGIEVRPESFGWSVIQTLISRGDRRLAPVFISIRGHQNSLGSWKKAYKMERENPSKTRFKNNIFPPLPPWEETINMSWETSNTLPWNHIKGPLNNDTLIKHLNEAIN